MAIELRRYQQELLDRVQDALVSNPKVRLMMQLPTGGGKTIIAGELLVDWLTGGRKAVWLTHRKELAKQTEKMLTKAGVSAITNVRWTPGDGAPAMAVGVVILMAQKVSLQTARREVWNQYRPTDLMIVDESHHAAAKGWERAIHQWPGPVVGMTATPWRLSEKEGFDHLFDELLCGPQVAELQAQGYLCPAQTLMPPPKQRIIGGAVNRTLGDYTESGIEQANSPNIMTAGALQFWQEHAGNRQTIAYAVSKKHARNLTSVFNDAGVKAAVLLSETPPAERKAAIDGFKEGRVQVLVNVLIATEGFDLPDASCVLITRPTMSLAIYLQMMGRGLRPKPDGGDCIIMDLAGNSVTHGLPEENREWSLEPRGQATAGEAPVVWCEKCFTASPAASHNCRKCGADFGKDCDRCGKWRAWKRWEFENHCGKKHPLVCDLCHIDAHIRAHLPVVPPLDILVDICDDREDEMIPDEDFEMDDDMADRLKALFRELLEADRKAIVGADDAEHDKLDKLRLRIERLESALNNESELDQLFNEHIEAKPPSERPQGWAQGNREFANWKRDLQSELDDCRRELAELIKVIFNSARSKAMHLLQKAAQDRIDWPPERPDKIDPDTEGSKPISRGWYKLSELGNTVSEKGWKPLAGLKPSALRFPNENKNVSSWKEMYESVVEWLFDEKHLSPDDIPSELKKFFRPEEWRAPQGYLKTIKVRDRLFLITALDAGGIVFRSCRFIQAFGEDPAQFQVQLR